MEVNELKDRTNWKLCQTHNCSADASNICLTDRVVICNMCAAVFHYDCDVKIKDGEWFINHALKSWKDLVNTMINRGMETRIDTHNFLQIFNIFYNNKQSNYNIFKI